MRRASRYLVGWAVAAGLLAGMGVAEALEGQRVVKVDVRGTRTIANETILAKVRTTPGMSYQERVVSEDIRRIFSLGYFTDVQTDVEALPGGLQVIFVVSEKPTIEAIEVKGNHAIHTRRLLELFGVTEGQLYDARAVKEGVSKIKAEYSRKGFSESTVFSRFSVREAQGMATIHLLVDEGAQMRISQILVEGNLAFSDRRIRRLLKTKRRRWFGLGHGVYQEEVLEEDMERVQAFYRKHGYQDVGVTQTVAQEPSGDGLIVHLTVVEGLQHRVGQIAVEGNVLFPTHDIRQVLMLKPGAIYNREGLQEDLRLIKEYYGDQGYINAEITPDTRFDETSERVNLTYHIVENELIYLNRIDIRGNLRTRDVVVRREIRVYPGEPFDGERLRQTIDRLYNLGYFEEVRVDTEPTEDPTREDLVVHVKETKTGSFSFGGGFSSVDRLVGLVELEQRNFDWRNFPSFTGAGQDLRLRIQAGTVRRFFDISWTEPWFLGRPLSFGVDLYNRTRQRSGNLGFAFEEERRGAGFRLGKEFHDEVNVGLNYQLFRTEISNIVAGATPDLKAEQGRSDISVAGLSVSLDRRNNRFDPVNGFFLSASADLAGGLLAGDREFWRLQGGGSHYRSHGTRFVFESRVRGGIVNEYSDTAEVPIFERFFAGGANTVRGFQERRVGPRDAATNDPIGGEAILVGGLEEVMTLISDERGRPILKASLFYDVGNVWRNVDDFATSFKSGAGIGARVNTPIGPVRFDIGVPVSGLGGEKRKARFHFNVSRSF